MMQTVQIRLPVRQLRAVDKLVKREIYPNRSEAIRSAVRAMVDARKR